jgi:glutathione S-transferase
MRDFNAAMVSLLVLVAPDGELNVGAPWHHRGAAVAMRTRGEPMIRVTAFRWVPPFAQGLVRDLRVRWALEEAGLPYEEHLIDGDDQKSAYYRALQPFGQVPVLEEDESTMFESGAIVLHIAERSPALMPDGGRDRERVRTWMLAALNTVEPPIMMLNFIDLQAVGVGEGTKPLRETVAARVGTRLDNLASFLGDREHLVADRFTAADLLMTTVLRALRNTDLVASRATLDAYRRRGETRPAFQKALEAQMAAFAKHAPSAAGQ